MTALDDALALARLAKLSTDEWLARVAKGLATKPTPGRYTLAQLRATAHYKAHVKLMEAAKPPAPKPAPIPPPRDTSRAESVLFAAQEPQKAKPTSTKYAIALSADKAYRYPTEDRPDLDLRPIIKAFRDKGHRVLGWCDCRPAPGGTPASVGAQFVKDYDLDYFIGQAESSDQFTDAYDHGARVMIGQRDKLTTAQIALLSTDVLLIQEDYWNEGWARDPSPDIAAYCAGIYPTALWNPQIQNYRDAGRWANGDGLYHVAAVEDWQNLP